MQPQDRKSRAPGDSAASVEARSRLLAAGIGGALVEGLRQRFASLPLHDNAVVVDLGSGSGDALAACIAGTPATGVGIDLSTHAASLSARRFPHLTWVVANADRRLPIVDRRISFLLSLHGRRNPVECARVLAPQGWLVVAVPAPQDLIELRTAIQGKQVERSRIEAVLNEHAQFFNPVERFSSREHHTLNRESLMDVLQSTYRGARTSVRQEVDSLSTMEITLASDCVLFQKKPTM